MQAPSVSIPAFPVTLSLPEGHLQMGLGAEARANQGGTCSYGICVPATGTPPFSASCLCEGSTASSRSQYCRGPESH